MTRISKPDVTSTDVDYWEKVLESYRLGIHQLGLQEEPEPDQEEPEVISLEELPDERNPETTPDEA